MATVHPGATLTPAFRDFLPGWVARQPWYRGQGTPSLTPVGFFRLEDAGGQVGMETRLASDGRDLYQIPMTYRGAPIRESGPPGAGGFARDEPWLITTAEHSVLGTRWIYDAPGDPVWTAEMLRLVLREGVTEPGGTRGAGPAQARGRLLTAGPIAGDPVIALNRVLTAGEASELPRGPDVLGVVMGRWHLRPGSIPAEGCLAVVRKRPAPGSGDG